MKRLVLTILGAIAISAVLAMPAAAAQVINGSFTDGLNGWQVQTESGSAGDWSTYSGSTLPVSGNAAPAPLDGSAAVADESMPASMILYQDVSLEAGATHTLSLDYWVDNQGADWLIPNPPSLSFATPANQQVRIDVIKPSAAADTLDPDDILQTIYAPVSGDPANLPWTNVTAELSAFAGQSVRLRFVDVNNNDYLHFGVDNVTISTSALPAPPSPGPPLLKILSIDPSSYKASGKLGTTVNYSLNRSAAITIRTLKAKSGRRSGSKCVRDSKSNRSAKKCTRWIKLPGLYRTDAKEGNNVFAFDGTPDGKALKSGSYRLLVAAYAPGYENAAPTATASFKVR